MVAIYVENRELVVPGDLLAENTDIHLGEGTFRENGKVYSAILGLTDIKNKKVRIIPLVGPYIPKVGDIVIGKVTDVKTSSWLVDVNAPYPAVLHVTEIGGRPIDFTKEDISKIFATRETVIAKVIDVNEMKHVKISIKGRGLGKLENGRIIHMPPMKVPRLIGRGGSMINMIKKETNCKIAVGQNGRIWARGSQEGLALLIKALRKIERESHTSGLTDRIHEMLRSESK